MSDGGREEDEDGDGDEGSGYGKTPAQVIGLKHLTTAAATGPAGNGGSGPSADPSLDEEGEQMVVLGDDDGEKSPAEKTCQAPAHLFCALRPTPASGYSGAPLQALLLFYRLGGSRGTLSLKLPCTARAPALGCATVCWVPWALFCSRNSALAVINAIHRCTRGYRTAEAEFALGYGGYDDTTVYRDNRCRDSGACLEMLPERAVGRRAVCTCSRDEISPSVCPRLPHVRFRLPTISTRC